MQWGVNLGMDFSAAQSDSVVIQVFQFNSENKRGGVVGKMTYVKHCSQDERNVAFVELRPNFIAMSTNTYVTNIEIVKRWSNAYKKLFNQRLHLYNFMHLGCSTRYCEERPYFPVTLEWVQDSVHIIKNLHLLIK